MTMPRAEDWRSRGGHFSWRPAARDAYPVEVFHVELGPPALRSSCSSTAGPPAASTGLTWPGS